MSDRAYRTYSTYWTYNQFGTTPMTPPTFTDILRAKQTVSRYLPRTPLVHYPALDKAVGTRVLIKHENQQLTGAFKVRGGVNLVSQLPAGERARGVISASTGNHGQSIAFAARLRREPDLRAAVDTWLHGSGVEALDWEQRKHERLLAA